jgi:hypothetical protein
MAGQAPLLIVPDPTGDSKKVHKDATRFDIISAYKTFVSDPDVSDLHLERSPANS